MPNRVGVVVVEIGSGGEVSGVVAVEQIRVEARSGTVDRFQLRQHIGRRIGRAVELCRRVEIPRCPQLLPCGPYAVRVAYIAVPNIGTRAGDARPAQQQLTGAVVASAVHLNDISQSLRISVLEALDHRNAGKLRPRICQRGRTAGRDDAGVTVRRDRAGEHSLHHRLAYRFQVAGGGMVAPCVSVVPRRHLRCGDRVERRLVCEDRYVDLRRLQRERGRKAGHFGHRVAVGQVDSDLRVVRLQEVQYAVARAGHVGQVATGACISPSSSRVAVNAEYGQVAADQHVALHALLLLAGGPQKIASSPVLYGGHDGRRHDIHLHLRISRALLYFSLDPLLPACGQVIRYGALYLSRMQVARYRRDAQHLVDMVARGDNPHHVEQAQLLVAAAQQAVIHLQRELHAQLLVVVQPLSAGKPQLLMRRIDVRAVHADACEVEGIADGRLPFFGRDKSPRRVVLPDQRHEMPGVIVVELERHAHQVAGEEVDPGIVAHLGGFDIEIYPRRRHFLIPSARDALHVTHESRKYIVEKHVALDDLPIFGKVLQVPLVEAQPLLAVAVGRLRIGGRRQVLRAAEYPRPRDRVVRVDVFELQGVKPFAFALLENELRQVLPPAERVSDTLIVYLVLGVVLGGELVQHVAACQAVELDIAEHRVGHFADLPAGVDAVRVVVAPVHVPHDELHERAQRSGEREPGRPGRRVDENLVDEGVYRALENKLIAVLHLGHLLDGRLSVQRVNNAIHNHKVPLERRQHAVRYDVDDDLVAPHRLEGSFGPVVRQPVRGHLPAVLHAVHLNHRHITKL